jgi:hypothetical protein
VVSDFVPVYAGALIDGINDAEHLAATETLRIRLD